MFEASEHFKTADDLHRATVESVIQMMGLTNVEREGSDMSWRSLCPFHNEKTPSFHVDFEQGVFHCFGCQEGGRVRRLLRKVLGINNLQSIVLESILLPGGPVAQKPKMLERLPEVTLAQYPRMKVSKYLWRRGIRKQETMEAFDVRFDAVMKRIIIPVRHVDGALVGFIERRIIDEDSEGPKYLHSVSAKTLTLFNLHRAWTKSRKVVVLAEGPLDVLRCYDAGFHYCIATLGGALALEQAELLRQSGIRLVGLAFDNDENGPLYESITSTRLDEVGVVSRRLIVPRHRKDLGECTDAEIAHILRGGNARG